MRKYFISYFFQSRKGQGHGSCQINWHGLIRDIKDIDAIAEAIRSNNKFTHITIVNWRRFEDPAALLTSGKEAA
jgi:hypothetical protein